MRRIANLIPFVLLALLVFLPSRSAAAESITLDGQIVIGQSFTLESDKTLNGDLMVIGGSVTIQKDAKVNGNVFVMGGGLDMNGEVTGDIAVVGGSIVLGSSAHVHGNLAAVGATIARASGAQVDGEIFDAANSLKDVDNDLAHPDVPPPVPPALNPPAIQLNLMQGLLSLYNIFSQAVALALLTMIVMLFLAPHAGRVARSVTNQPLVAGGIGLLSIVLSIIGIVILAVTLILIPLALIATVILVVAILFGWIAIGYEVGLRFTKAIHQEWHPAFSAALGVFALTFISNVLVAIPGLKCIGWLAPFALGLAALGGVLMSNFGTRIVEENVPPAPSAPPAPPAPLPPALPEEPAKSHRKRKSE